MLTNLGDAQWAVRAVGSIADVHNRLVRQLIHDGTRHCQPTDTGVEDANRRCSVGEAAILRRQLIDCLSSCFCSHRYLDSSYRWSNTEAPILGRFRQELMPLTSGS